MDNEKPIEEKEEELLKTIKDYLLSLPYDESRKEFIGKIECCHSCGSMYLPCYCYRDD